MKTPLPPDWRCPVCTEVIRDLWRRGPHLAGCRRKQGQGSYAKAKYTYVDGDTAHPYEEKPCEGCGVVSLIQTRRRFCSRKCSKTKTENPAWKGDDAGYV